MFIFHAVYFLSHVDVIHHRLHIGITCFAYWYYIFMMRQIVVMNFPSFVKTLFALCIELVLVVDWHYLELV